MDLFSNQEALAIIFAGLMGLSILAYVILDGYDLGVGILMSQAREPQRDQMIASIGPFWDANETWLVLGVGLLLVAFPLAHGQILSALYIPTALMLVGLTLRGVSFDFRAKARDKHKHLWDGTFIGGSLLASMAQGYMLGLYILGFDTGLGAALFGLLTGLCLSAGYVLVGASWLIMKTEGPLQARAIHWAKWGLWGTAAGMAMISLATPFASPRIFEKWFSLPNLLLLAPIPLMTMLLVALVAFTLGKLPKPDDRYCWVPFAGSVGLFILGFQGLAYSFYPYLIPDRLTILDAAAAPESLAIILVGALVVLPFIIGYTIFAYRVFWGKVRSLSYY